MSWRGGFRKADGCPWSARGRVAPRVSYARQEYCRARGESRASPTIRPCMLPPHWRGAAAQDREGRRRSSLTPIKNKAAKREAHGLPWASLFARPLKKRRQATEPPAFSILCGCAAPPHPPCRSEATERARRPPEAGNRAHIPRAIASREAMLWQGCRLSPSELGRNPPRLVLGNFVA